MSKLLIALCLLLVANTGLAEDRFTSQTFGFSMDVAIENNPEAPLTQVAFFFLDGASNVNVQVHKFEDKIDDYDAISTRQFEAREWEVISRKITENDVTYEYKGKFNDREMHWYARAIKRGNRIYAVTATTMAGKWEAHKKKLIQSVDSFKLNEQKPQQEKTDAPEKIE